jgi:hypothetical protein
MWDKLVYSAACIYGELRFAGSSQDAINNILAKPENIDVAFEYGKLSHENKEILAIRVSQAVTISYLKFLTEKAIEK